ncbi:hypothetical protein ACGFJ7_14020 [Actinoplanes sp. NPDC048988]|uniref:hypothetical protein n=1 Tax=Actinoplanes sp. NPDC048988 TaxID=3363901 RepID=UPI0037196BF1
MVASIVLSVLDAGNYTGLIDLKSRLLYGETSGNHVFQDSVSSPAGYCQRIHLINGNYQYINLQKGRPRNRELGHDQERQ